MSSIFGEPAAYDRAVCRTAEIFIAKFGSLADLEAWTAARRPTLTHSERAYCEAVARRVSSLLGSVAAAPA
ncbi:MAG: hypothetical protein KDK03_07660 [Rhodobacteraceae bacterium]|uniref:hypothetical protein n=1 Tax=Amaricoccus sp. B4 TaxID=3368557 RepID=UPI0013A68C61|nr:hypothetical protein [Paracoccaceae bacterium]